MRSIQVNVDNDWPDIKEIDVSTTYPFLETKRFLYFYGQPRKKSSILNSVSVFSPQVWSAILGCFVLVSGTFQIIRLSYMRIESNGLLRSGITATELAFKVLATLTEPDRIDAFPKWSTG